MNTSIWQRGALALGGAALLLSATVGYSMAQAATPRQGLGLHQRAQIGKLVRQELSIAASKLGYADVQALRKDLSGTTLTALAQKHNVGVATVSSAMKADVDAKVQSLADSGKIKPKRIAGLKVRAEARVDRLMTRQFK